MVQQVAVLLRLLVLWSSQQVIFPRHYHRCCHIVRYWILSQHTLSKIQMDTCRKQSHLVRIFTNILISTRLLYSLPLPNYYESLLARIITDLNSIGQPYVCDMMYWLVLSFLEFWFLNLILSVSLSVGWVGRESSSQRETLTPYSNILTFNASYVPNPLFHIWLLQRIE